MMPLVWLSNNNMQHFLEFGLAIKAPKLGKLAKQEPCWTRSAHVKLVYLVHGVAYLIITVRNSP